MKRRSFLELVPVGTMGLLIAPTVTCSKTTDDPEFVAGQIELQINHHQPLELPPGKRVPFGWPVVGIGPGETIHVNPQEHLPQENLWLRISVAQEIWDEKRVHVRIAETGTALGTIDIRYSSVLVPYELKISGEHASAINQYGLEMELEAKSPLWIFSGPPEGADNMAFVPHILHSSNEKGKTDHFLNCFTSINSVQAFGWREGTVLDGLWQLYSRKGNKKALQTIHNHLGLFFDDKKNLIYETSQSFPRDNRTDGIESTIPFATLARLDADHPVLQIVLAAWESYTKPNGMVIDGEMISAEGCYTVAYPMAVIGKIRQDHQLQQNALEQLRHRLVLLHNGKIYLRNTAGNYSYPNWARGVAWFLLGFARTLSELKSEDQELVQKFREAAEIALSMQQEDGLWNCFMDQPESLPDTSGSAGIAAAILTGFEIGILPKHYKTQAKKCWNGLQNYITPDGFLKGVAQDNRGGVKLQMSDYRVIAQMGMGMMVQLYAGL